jgi:hypothetical protein
MNKSGIRRNRIIINRDLKINLFITICILLFSIQVDAQKTWDGGAGTNNWGDANNWNPNGVPTAGQNVTISDNDGFTVVVNGNYQCNSLTLEYTGNTWNAGTIELNIPNGNTLDVTNAVTIDNTVGWRGIFMSKTVQLDVSGILNCSSIDLNESNYDPCASRLLINTTGVVNVSGNVSLDTEVDRTDITVNGAGYLGIGGNFTSGGGVFNPGNGTVEYTGGGAQQVLAEDYYNLAFSGGGTKTLQGDVSVSNNLNLLSGNVSLGAGTNDLTLLDGANISGTFSSTNMIVCDGNGSLIKEGNAGTDFEMVFPVGTGTSYTPMEITSMTSTGTGNVSVRVVGNQEPNANPSDLQRYWEVDHTVGLTSADLSFTYLNPGDVGTGDQTTYIPNVYNGGWIIPTGISAEGTNPMTVSGTGTLTGNWTAREAPNITTYYSYQSGDWGTASTWTTDPSGTLSQNPGVPDTDDRVVILNGRTVYTTNAKSLLSTQINEGGILDLRNTTGHNLGDVSGQGRIRLQTNTFPGGSFAQFVSDGGGTVEYYNTSNFALTQYEYNNLIINLSVSAQVVSVTSDLTVNGDLTIEQGVFRINNNSSTTRLDLSVAGNVLVESNGEIATGSGNIGTNFNDAHRFIIQGNFTINGEAHFSNLSVPDYFNFPNDRVDVVFNNPTADQDVLINGLTEFYRIEIDKGTDQTYVLNIDATAPNLFYLFGSNDNMGVTPSPDAPNIINQNALGLQTGTVRLGANINLPSLAEEWNPGNDLNYHVDEDACLWIDGATVTHTTHANGGTSNSFVLYGKIRISNPASSFTINNLHGIVMRANASIVVEDGTLSTPCIRTSTVAGTHRGSYNQSGGTVTITGNITGANRHASLSLSYPEMSFKMSGGDLIIEEATNGGEGDDFSMVVGARSENISVTGGTIHLIADNRNADFATTTPFWNLSLEDASGGTYVTQNRDFVSTAGDASSVNAQELVVYNNLTIDANAEHQTNGQDVSVGNNFTINASGTYTPGNNLTRFNGDGGQVFQINGNITSGLYDLEIDNTSNTTITNNLTIRNDLTINTGCFLNDQGNIITLASNVYNSGTHTSQAGGGLLLNATTDQNISGSGQGIFGTIIIDKTSGTASLTANQSLTGNLRLANGLLNAGIYQLSLGAGSHVYDALTGTTTVFSGSKMIQTSGNPSDGGVSKEFDVTGSFLFPVGTGSDYTPATLQINSAPSTWGSINVKPVAQFNPFVTSNNSLNYYWKVTSQNFSGLSSGSVSHTYNYVDADIVGRGTEANYIPGRYSPYAWTVINDPSQVNDASNSILFSTVDYIEGDFTAGEIDAFQGVQVYYSRQSGDWDDVNTWSTTVVGGPVAGTVPTTNNPVVIGDGAGQNHLVTVPAGLNNLQVGGLQINSGSTLDLTTTTGHNFGSIPDSKITGNGLLRISSATATAEFPGGDFGNFLNVGGGTVEYYSTGTQDFTLPSNIAGYNNLIVSPDDARTITLSDIDLMVFNDLTIQGTGTGVAGLNSASAKTLNIGNDLVITGGYLRFLNNAIQTVYVENDITINASGSFEVSNTGTGVANELYIMGNVDNDGTFDMYVSGTRYCNVFFAGDTDKELSGAGTNEFNYLTVDKGNSRNTILDITADNLSLNGAGTALLLENGTFRVSNPALNFILSTSSSFTIPISAALSVNEGSVTIGTTDNDGDLILVGRLEVINNGIINIGTGGNYNNDIIYASGGDPEIIVEGSSQLNVNGQIRRSVTLINGSLHYTQSGGTVTIQGENQTSIRSKLEILNASSEFNMSGGSIIFVNGGGDQNYYGDVTITPENATVTGGTIQFGTASTSTTDFSINASAPIWNLVIDGNTSNTLDIRVSPIEILNDLTINGSSEFRTNGLDVIIGGSLTNNNTSAAAGLTAGGYQPGSLTQTTTFNGSGSQTISGSGTNLTNFANLVNQTIGSLTLGANTMLQVNNDLSLTSGTLEDSGNTVAVLGDIDNQASHSSSLATGGILLSGTQKQTISGNGNGTFGNIEIDNSLGIEMVDNITFDGVFTLTSGNIYIDDYQLTFGTNASIAGTPDNTKMIIANGVISDAGVRKIFNASNTSFTYPLGVAGKYTPVSYTFSAAPDDGASITVKPVNSENPFMFNADGDELNFYWNITTNGFTSAYTVDQSYTYIDADVEGTESAYVAGRFYAGSWVPVGGIPGTVNTAGNQINLSGVDYLEGEYTAGETGNFSNKPTLYSITSGNWSNGNTWSTTGHTGASCSCTPDGNPVIIDAAHTITLATDGAEAYSVEIEGTLDVGQTVYHSLGHITGGGKINLTSTSEGIFVLPGGNFDVFLANPSSTIEFSGTNTASLPLKPGNNYKPYQNVIFSGTGTKQISAEDLKILGNLTINDPTVLDNSLYNRDITILGNWNDYNTSASGGYIPGTGNVIFKGTSQQTLTVSNGGTTEQFYDLEINNSAGLVLAGGGQAEASGRLYLTNGTITTNYTNLLSISNSSPNASSGGSSNSFVSGPLQKRINAGSYFDFPVGDNIGTRYGHAMLSSVSTTGNYIFEYLNHNPGDDGYDPSSKVVPVDVVSNIEYWHLNGPGGSTADVIVRWDDQSSIIPPSAIGRTKLRIVEWNGSAWENRGGEITDGGLNSGTIQTDPEVAVNGDHYFTIGVESLPTATITSSDASICDDGESTSISIELTGTPPWTLRYEVNGANETTINNIATTPFNLVVSNALSPLDGGPGDYIFNLSYVQDATGSTGIQDFTSTVTTTLNESPTPVISGNTTVAISEIVTYSTPLVAGHTYQWTVNNGTILGSSTNNTVTIQWASTDGSGWVRVEETATIGGCSTITNNYDVTITDIPNPQVTGPDPVCLNETVTYRTPDVGTHTYSWSLPAGGGTIIGSTTLDSVVVQWTSSGNYSVRVDETGSTTENDILPVTVNVLPASNNVVTDPTICEGQTASIVVESAAAGISYQLRLNSDDSPVGTPVSSGPGGDVSLPVTPAASTQYNVYATNEFSCSVELTDLSDVTVNTAATVEAGSNESICSGTDFDLSTSTTLPSATDYTSLAWSTSGDGSFDDFTALIPVYTPGSNDISAGSVTLTLTAIGVAPCSNVNDNMSLTIVPTPDITNPGNQTACDSYTLPAIGGSNLSGNEAYYTGSGGTGSVLAAGSSITSTQTIYIYDETTTTPACSDEESFTVTINTSPVPSITGDTDVCETLTNTYSTSATGNNFTWTVTGGNIDSGQGTNEITVTWDTLTPAGTLSSTGTVEVTESDPGSGCSGNTSVNITIHRIPETGDPNHIDPGYAN